MHFRWQFVHTGLVHCHAIDLVVERWGGAGRRPGKESGKAGFCRPRAQGLLLSHVFWSGPYDSLACHRTRPGRFVLRVSLSFFVGLEEIVSEVSSSSARALLAYSVVGPWTQHNKEASATQICSPCFASHEAGFTRVPALFASPCAAHFIRRHTLLRVDREMAFLYFC